jgi:5-methylthioadenosine/S-adenosylhomocysteine deaminase
VVDILIRDALVLTLENGAQPIDRGFVAVQGGWIHSVGSMADLPPDLEAGRVIDGRVRMVLPGLVNAHVHGAMTLFRGLADDLPLMTWLNDYIFPAEAAHVSDDLVYWGTLLAAAEMLLCGATAVVDGYFLEDAAARAYRDAGLRTVAGQGVIDFPAPGVPDPADNVAAAARFIDRWQGDPLVRPSVFCHAPYTCSARTLTQAKAMAREKGALFQIHVAETAAEVEKLVAEKGLRPVEYLDSLGILDEETLAVHAVHVTDEEIDRLARTGTRVVTCPESNMKLASGMAPVAAMTARGVQVALGTDGPASNNNLNIFAEMRSLALAAKAFGKDPTLLPAGQVLGLAISGGAAALGLTGQIGRIAPGCLADLILVDACPPNLKPMYHPVSHLVYAASGREVRTVLVGGRVVVDEGRPTTIDLKETMARARAIAARIRP